MDKRWIGTALAIAVMLILGFVSYRQTLPGGYVPAEDEIALYIRLDTKEDLGLLLIDYKDADGFGGRGGISNADKTLLKHDDQLYYTLPKHAFDDPSDGIDLSIRFTVVTEYFEPNYEEIYPEEYMIPVDPISLRAEYGGACSITISGDKTNGYRAVIEG